MRDLTPIRWRWEEQTGRLTVVCLEGPSLTDQDPVTFIPNVEVELELQVVAHQRRYLGPAERLP